MKNRNRRAVLIAAALLCVCFLTDPMERAADAASETQGPDYTAPWSDFLAELIRVESEDGGYAGPCTYLGYARRYDAPPLRFPGAEQNMTDSGYVFIWDDGSGRLRLKELWFDEEEREAMFEDMESRMGDMMDQYNEIAVNQDAYEDALKQILTKKQYRKYHADQEREALKRQREMERQFQAGGFGGGMPPMGGGGFGGGFGGRF